VQKAPSLIKDAKGGFNSDLTSRNAIRMMQGFFFADAIGKANNEACSPHIRLLILTTGIGAYNVTPQSC
jgi:hypothetical protein